MMIRSGAVLAGALLLGAAVTEHTQSRYGRRQERFPTVAIMGGPTRYDLGSKGTGFVAALRFDVPINTMRTWLRRSLISLRECMEA